MRLDRLHIHHAVGVTRYGDHIVAGDGRTGGVRSVSAVGYKEGRFLVALPAMVSGHNHHTGQLAVRPG